MRHQAKLTLYAVILTAIALTSPHPANAEHSIIPIPKQVITGHGHFVINDQTQIVNTNPAMQAEAAMLQASIHATTGKMLTIATTGTDNVIILQTDAGIEGAEAYQLTIESQRVTCRASTAAGLFYAGQSLLQLLDNEGKIPCMDIRDEPRFEWRGMMLDESRHFFGKAVVKQYLDIMARLKMNRFHWHLTDEPGWRIEIKQYPRLTEEGADGSWSDYTAPRAFYTQDEIREIVAYAAERHIMVIPEIDMPGHASAAVRAYPELSGGGKGRWMGFTFHPAKAEVYEFINNVLTEVAGLFPAPYIHIGADEVHFGNQCWFTDPVIQQFIKDNNLENEVGMEHYFVRRATAMVNALGKTMIGWDEIVGSGVLPDEAVVMWWRHNRSDQLKAALDKGFRVILTPRVPCYMDFVQDQSHRIGRRWGNVDPFGTLAMAHEFPARLDTLIDGRFEQVMGLQANVWTERMADKKRLDFMLFPRVVALAESGWSAASQKDEDDFLRRLKPFLRYLDGLGIYYFNPFDKDSTPEPWGPDGEAGWSNRPEYQEEKPDGGPDTSEG